MESKKFPVIVAGSGFLVCLISFVLAWAMGKSQASMILFFVGFGICFVGVLVGFGRFRKDV